jgi:hypothetical protein
MLIFLGTIAILSTTYLIKMLYDEKKKIDEEEAQFTDTSVTKRIKEKYSQTNLYKN